MDEKEARSISLCKFLFWCTGNNQYMCNLVENNPIPVEFQTLCNRCIYCKELDIPVRSSIGYFERRIQQ